jgi:dynein heavy chain
LAKHNLEGMETLTSKFKDIIEDFKKKRHELLDTNVNKFDRDWVEFNVEISHLDVAL